MSQKNCLIYQPAGIGDILFCQGIVKHYVNKGYNVIYPTNSNLFYLKDYLKHPGVTYYDKEDDFPFKDRYNNNNRSILDGDFVFVNLDKSQEHVPPSRGFMISKYEMVGLDHNIWKQNLHITRNKEREDWLFYKHLKLKDGEKYILTNNKFGTPPDTKIFPLPQIDTSYKLVDMPYIDGTTIMDWIKVIEKARGIVTVDTCIQYIMEILDIDYKFYYCYSRTGESSFLKNIKDIFTIPWNYQTLN